MEKSIPEIQREAILEIKPFLLFNNINKNRNLNFNKLEIEYIISGKFTASKEISAYDLSIRTNSFIIEKDTIINENILYVFSDNKVIQFSLDQSYIELIKNLYTQLESLTNDPQIYLFEYWNLNSIFTYSKKKDIVLSYENNTNEKYSNLNFKEYQLDDYIKKLLNK